MNINLLNKECILIGIPLDPKESVKNISCHLTTHKRPKWIVYFEIEIDVRTRKDKYGRKFLIASNQKKNEFIAKIKPSVDLYRDKIDQVIIDFNNKTILVGK